MAVSRRPFRTGSEETDEQPEPGEAPPRDLRDDEPAEPDFLKNLQSLNVGELRRVVAFAEARIREREVGEKAALKARLLQEVQDSGFSLADLFGEASPAAKPARKPRSEGVKAERAPVPVKFRGPNPGDTWSGRGREPGWLKALVAQGHSREQYRVEQTAA